MSLTTTMHDSLTANGAHGTRRTDAPSALVVETRIGTATRWFDAGARGCSERAAAPTRPADLVLIGDDVAIAAVLGGHLSPHDAEREGQLEVIGPRTHLNALQIFLSFCRSARAA